MRAKFAYHLGPVERRRIRRERIAYIGRQHVKAGKVGVLVYHGSGYVGVKRGEGLQGARERHDCAAM
jgi:hypothetical protein